MAKKKQFILTIGVHTADGHHQDGIWNVFLSPKGKKARKLQKALDLLNDVIGEPDLDYDNNCCQWKRVPVEVAS